MDANLKESDPYGWNVLYAPKVTEIKSTYQQQVEALKEQERQLRLKAEQDARAEAQSIVQSAIDAEIRKNAPSIEKYQDNIAQINNMLAGKVGEVVLTYPGYGTENWKRGQLDEESLRQILAGNQRMIAEASDPQAARDKAFRQVVKNHPNVFAGNDWDNYAFWGQLAGQTIPLDTMQQILVDNLAAPYVGRLQEQYVQPIYSEVENLTRTYDSNLAAINQDYAQHKNKVRDDMRAGIAPPAQDTQQLQPRPGAQDTQQLQPRPGAQDTQQLQPRPGAQEAIDRVLDTATYTPIGTPALSKTNTQNILENMGDVLASFPGYAPNAPTQPEQASSNPYTDFFTSAPEGSFPFPPNTQVPSLPYTPIPPTNTTMPGGSTSDNPLFSAPPSISLPSTPGASIPPSLYQPSNMFDSLQRSTTLGMPPPLPTTPADYATVFGYTPYTDYMGRSEYTTPMTANLYDAGYTARVAATPAPTATMNRGGVVPSAQSLASRGRNGDSMLVHMTPGEVKGLQALAMAHGGSLTINPDTGLVEANFLKRILPAIAGAALAATGIGAPMAGLMVGGFETIRTGDLGQGLLAGLGAFGGAGMGNALSTAGQASTQAAAQTAAAGPDLAAQTTAMGDIGAGQSFYGNTLGPEITPATPTFTETGAQLAPTATPTTTAAPTLTPEQITAGQLPGTAATGPSKIADMGAGFESLGAESDVGRRAFMKDIGGYSGLAQSTLATAAPFAYVEPEPIPTPEDPYANYKGPVKPSERAVSYPTDEERRRRGTSEFMYFTPSNPIPYADGGKVASATNTTSVPFMNSVRTAMGIPALAAMMPAARPASRTGLVYNPIPNSRTEKVYNPVAFRNLKIPSRETTHGFKPVEYVNKPDLSGLDLSRWARIRDKMDGGDGSGIRAQYEFDRATQTLRPSQAYLDAIETRRQQIAAEQAAAAEVAANAYSGGGFEKGGSVPTLEEGGFVLTKKAVDGLGGGSNKRGQKVAARGLGAVPIKGPGTGTSDSIPTTIAGKQRALVSNGEAYVPAKKVKQNGGAKAFYALMARAEKAARR